MSLGVQQGYDKYVRRSGFLTGHDHIRQVCLERKFHVMFGITTLTVIYGDGSCGIATFGAFFYFKGVDND